MVRIRTERQDAATFAFRHCLRVGDATSRSPAAQQTPASGYIQARLRPHRNRNCLQGFELSLSGVALFRPPLLHQTGFEIPGCNPGFGQRASQGDPRRQHSLRSHWLRPMPSPPAPAEETEEPLQRCTPAQPGRYLPRRCPAGVLILRPEADRQRGWRKDSL